MKSPLLAKDARNGAPALSTGGGRRWASHQAGARSGGAAVTAGLGEFAARGIGSWNERSNVLRWHRDIDVFENLAWSDADHAFGGFDQIVTFADRKSVV